MKVPVLNDMSETTKALFNIMNSRDNGIHQTYEKKICLKLYFNSLLDTVSEPALLFKEFETAMDLYIDRHIERWGFFSFERDYFLSMLEY